MLPQFISLLAILASQRRQNSLNCPIHRALKSMNTKGIKSIDSDSNSNQGQPFIVVTNPAEHQAADQ